MGQLASKLDALLQGVQEQRRDAAEQRRLLQDLEHRVSVPKQRAAEGAAASADRAPTALEGFGSFKKLREVKASAKASSFELCPQASNRQILTQGNSLRHGKSQEKVSANLGSVCDAETEVPVFQPFGNGSYTVACCAKSSVHCTGCAELSEAGDACNRCSGGYVQGPDGVCEACMDVVAWTDAAGLSCSALTSPSACTSVRVNQYSSMEACCQCGGGHRAGTAFTYYVGPAVLGAPSIVGHPVPRTATNYMLNEGCELLKHGLTISGKTGELMFAEGCSALGCGATDPFSVSCTVTAQSFINFEPRFERSFSASVAGNVSFDTVSWSTAVVNDTELLTDRNYKFTGLGGYASDCLYLRGPKDLRLTSSSEAAKQRAFRCCFLMTPIRTLCTLEVQWQIQAPFPSMVYLDMWANQQVDGFANWADASSWTQSAMQGIQTQVNFDFQGSRVCFCFS